MLVTCNLLIKFYTIMLAPEIIEAPHATVLENGNVILSFETIHDDTELPEISVVTITRNRSQFYPLMIRNMSKFEYPKHRIEWIVIEDGDSSFEGVMMNRFKNSGMKLTYKGIGANGKLAFPIGYKRNIAASLATHDIIIHMDDDDYYPPESLIARARTLEKFTDTYDCTGCLKVRTFNLFSERTVEAFEGSAINMSESTLAYRRSFWEQKKFRNECSSGEGVAFLEDRYERCVSLPYVFVVTQLDHLANTIQRNLPNAMGYGQSFLKTIDAETSTFLTDLRDKIMRESPETRQLVSFIKLKCLGNMKKAAKRLSSLPLHLQRSPLAVEIRRKYPSGQKYDIVFYCASGSCMTFDSEWGSGSFGGSEEAVTNLAESFASLGRKVTVFNQRTEPTVIRNVTYLPWYTFHLTDPCDTVIVWRDPSNLTLTFNARRVLLDLHDLVLMEWLGPQHIQSRAYRIIVKSEYHQKTCVPRTLHGQCTIVPNGIKVDELFYDGKKQRIVLSTSSPERCWLSLYRLANDLKQIPEFNDVRVIHAYSLEAVQRSVYWKRLKHLPRSGLVELRGKLSSSTMSLLYRHAKLFVHPTTFPEIDCVSLTKAVAAGCICVHSSAGAMLEKANVLSSTICVETRTTTNENGTILCESFELNDDEYGMFLTKVIEALRSDTPQAISTSDNEVLMNKYSLQAVTKRWLSMIEENDYVS